MRTPWRTSGRVALAAAVAGSLLIAVPEAGQAATPPKLKVMTQNLYLGSSLDPAIEATGGAEFLAAVATIYSTAIKTDFPARAKAIAASIKAQRPTLVGLQEVSKWTFARTNEGPALPSYDFLTILLGELKNQGLNYKVGGSVNNALISAPLVSPVAEQACPPPPEGSLVFSCSVTLQDRDVILYNASAKTLRVSGKKSGRYEAQASLPTPLGAVSFDRGWVSVEVRYQGKRFRFVNTHLEVEGFAKIQEAQAAEFLAGPAKSRGTVIATGDFNSASDGSTSKSYKILTRKYFDDAWVVKRDGKGLTCCQNSDLSNTSSQYKTRIDLVLTHGNAVSTKAVRVNDRKFQSTVPLWPSDHAGVVATVKLT